jgi:branched-subunit amino acid aminotransferase/4-amino-4-deoxychorismate lyase
MPEALAYLHGQFIPAKQASLPLHDAGFVMGATVTDLCRTVRHQLYRFDDHLKRFLRSCESVGIALPSTKDEVTRLAHELADHNATLLPPAGDLALVMFATPGPIGYYAGLEGGPGDGQPTLGMHTFPLPFARYRNLFRLGAQLTAPTIRQVPAASVDPRIKQRSRLHWWLAQRQVHATDPGAAAVLLNERDELTETAAANLLIVKKGTVYSPPPDTVLEGVSLLSVQELCGDLGLPFVRQSLTVADAQSADEMMLSSTGWCLCGVSRFNGQSVPWPGPVFERLLAAWSERIGLDIRRQCEVC